MKLLCKLWSAAATAEPVVLYGEELFYDCCAFCKASKLRKPTVSLGKEEAWAKTLRQKRPFNVSFISGIFIPFTLFNCCSFNDLPRRSLVSSFWRNTDSNWLEAGCDQRISWFPTFMGWAGLPWTTNRKWTSALSSFGAPNHTGNHACMLSHFSPVQLFGTSLPGSSVHGILQARILEWVAMISS